MRDGRCGYAVTGMRGTPDTGHGSRMCVRAFGSGGETRDSAPIFSQRQLFRVTALVRPGTILLIVVTNKCTSAVDLEGTGRRSRGSPSGPTHTVIPLPSRRQMPQPSVQRPARHEVRRRPRSVGLESEPSKHLVAVEAVDARDEAGRRTSLLTAQREQVGNPWSE